MGAGKAVANQLRSLVCVLLVAAAVSFVWGVCIYSAGITANIRGIDYDADANIGRAAEGLRNGGFAVGFLALVIACARAIPDPDRRARRTGKWLVMWLWVMASIPVVATCFMFGRLNFVRPDLVDGASSHGYLLMCISVGLLIVAATMGTVAVSLGGSEPGRWMEAKRIVGTGLWAAVVVALVLGVLATAPGIVSMRDEYRPGLVADMTPRVPSLDISRLQAVDPAISGDSWLVTAVGLVRANGSTLEAVDPMTGETRWMVHKAGTPGGAFETDVIGDGSVLLVRWRNLGVESAYAYAADTGQFLWKSDEGEESPPQWDELEITDQGGIVRDPLTGEVQTVITSRTTCPGASLWLRGERAFARCDGRDGDGNLDDDEVSTLIALDRRNGTELWRSKFQGSGSPGTETFDSAGCPAGSIDLVTGVSSGDRPCDDAAWRFTDAGSVLQFELAGELDRYPFTVVDRAGVRGARVDLGSALSVSDPLGGTRDHVFVRATDRRSEREWLLAVNNSTGAIDVLMGSAATPDGVEPRVRGVVTEDETVVIEAPWGVVIGPGYRASDVTGRSGADFGGRVEPRMVIPAS